jgi:hypothetical protein
MKGAFFASESRRKRKWARVKLGAPAHGTVLAQYGFTLDFVSGVGCNRDRGN